jgi:hypothetical protein
MSDAIDVDGVRYLSTAEAAERASLTQDYIALFCRQGKVRAKQDGRNWFIDPSSLDAFLAEHTALKEKRATELASQLRAIVPRSSHAGDAAAIRDALARAIEPQLPIAESTDAFAANDIFPKIAAATFAIVLLFGAATATSASARAFADETLAHLSAIGNNLANLAAVATPAISANTNHNSSPATSANNTAATSSENPFSTSPATSRETAPNATSYHTTHSKNVKPAAFAPANANNSTVSSKTTSLLPTANPSFDASAFVTQTNSTLPYPHLAIRSAN